MLNLIELLKKSSELEEALADFLILPLFDNSPRFSSSRILCGLSFEHAESVRVLIGTGNFTSSLGVLRMQYDALTKAIWVMYAAPDKLVARLQCELSNETAKAADKMPMLSEMLTQLSGKAPDQALRPLKEFREYSWKPLSSYIHGGIHAISRHGKGYPIDLLSQTIKSSNALLMMAGMMLVILSGDRRQQGRMPDIQRRFAGCCPDLTTH